MQWFRMYAEAVDNAKLRCLAFEDRWHYVALLCCKAQGIYENTHPDRFERMLRVKLGLQKLEFENAMKRLEDEGLIDEDLTPLGWDERQYKSDTSAERTRRYRERKRHCDVTVTPPETESDTDTEKDKQPTAASQIRKSDPIPVAKIIDLYHERLPELPTVQKVTKTRESYIKQRWREGDLPNLEAWGNFFDHVRQSDFLMGRAQPMNGRRPFRADIEWLVRPGNFAKIAEERYHE